MRVVYPFAPSYRCKTFTSTFGSMELAKKQKYNEVVMNEENGTFTPLIFSCNGGMSIETRKFFQRLPELTSEKVTKILVIHLHGLKAEFLFTQNCSSLY